jgi:hypothetical protein
MLRSSSHVSSFITIISLFAISLISIQTSYAGTSHTVNPPRNGVYDSMRISWTVTGAPNCDGSVSANFKNTTVRNFWLATQPSSGVSNTYSVTEAPDTYTFTCTENTYRTGISDISTLTVRTCGEAYGANYVWYQDGCYIAPTLGNFIYTPNTAPDVDYNERATLSWDGVSNVTSCTLTGGEFSSLSVGTSATGNRVTSPLTANTSYTLTCNGAGGQVSRSVTVPVAAGNINAQPLSCVITTPNANSCSVLLSWSSVNMSSPRVTNASDQTISILPNANNVPTTVYYGPNTFAIKNGTFSHNSVSVTAACDPTTLRWSRSACVSGVTSPSINSGTCYIQIGQSSCSLPVTWSILSPEGSVTVTRRYDSNSVFANTSSGSQNATFTYRPTPYTLDLRDNGIIRTSGSFNARCVGGTAWDSGRGVCYPTLGALSGYINDANCTIPIGGSTCQSPVVWGTVNAIGTIQVRESATVLYTGASGNVNRIFTGAESTVLNLVVDGTTIDSGTFSRSCQIGTVWNGTVCGSSNTSGNLSVSSSECLIAPNASTCQVNATWTTSNASNPLLVNGGTGATLSSLANGTLSVAVSYPNTTFILRDGAIALDQDQEIVRARCTNGGWNTTTGVCVNPSVVNFSVTGQYYEAFGTFTLTCSEASSYDSGSTSYEVTRTEGGGPVAGGPYNSPITFTRSQTGNYSAVCINGNVRSSPVVIYYRSSPPPSPTILLQASPRTIAKDSTSILSWSLQHPKPDCELKAQVICQQGMCDQNQEAERVRLNGIFNTGNTDEDNDGNDLLRRSIRDSLRTFPTSRTDIDWTSTGKKALSLKYTTDFEIECPSVNTYQKVRVQVTTTGER